MKTKPFKYLNHKGLTIYIDWSIPNELTVSTWSKDSEIKTWAIKTPSKKASPKKVARAQRIRLKQG